VQQELLQNVVKKSQSAKPTLCGEARRAPALRQKGASGALEAIDTVGKNRLFTALVAALDKAPPSALEPDFGPEKLLDLLNTPIGVFNQRTVAQQRNFVDEIWKRLCVGELASTLGQSMTEPGGQANQLRDPLPSSLAPENPDADQVSLKRRISGAWGDYTVGFRVDGKVDASGDDFTNRVRPNGCQPLTHNRGALLAVRGWVIDDTWLEKKDRIYIWCGNRDVVNETGTCVSRSLFGATAFPERTTDTAAGGIQYHNLLALNCRDLKGVDTEAWQMRQGVTSNWRPGEKVFLGIAPERVLGWTKLLRRPAPAAGGWVFMFPATDWTWVNRPNDITVAYLDGELRAWRANKWYTVPACYDFA
jgi:hypothetical protein